MDVIMDIPAELVLPISEPNKVMLEQCIIESANHYGIPEVYLRIIRDIEGGKVGTLKKNTNGSVDIGVMQINTINLPDILTEFENVGWVELAMEPCTSINVAAWFIKKKLKKANKTSPINALMDYNSSTPEVRIHYAFKVMEKFNEYQQKSLDGNLYKEALTYKYKESNESTE